MECKGQGLPGLPGNITLCRLIAVISGITASRPGAVAPTTTSITGQALPTGHSIDLDIDYGIAHSATISIAHGVDSTAPALVVGMQSISLAARSFRSMILMGQQDPQLSR